MGTTHNFDNPAASAIASGDTFPLIDVTTGRGKTGTVAQLISASSGVVDTTATVLALTAALHAGRIVTVSSTAPIAITLPASAGTGNKYRLNIRVVATTTGHTIKVANTTDVMSGIVVGHTTATTVATVVSFKATATDDTITINGTTQGGVVGDIIDLTDIKTGFWEVKMRTSPTGTHATPFSATV